MRGARVTPAAISTAQFESWFAKAAPVAVKEFGCRHQFYAPRRRRAAVQGRAGGADHHQRPSSRSAVCRRNEWLLVNSELQNKFRRQCVRPDPPRHIEVQLPPKPYLPALVIISAWCRATIPCLVDAVARRFGFHARGSDQVPTVAEGPPRAIADWRCRVGRAPADPNSSNCNMVATRKQIQIMSEHTRCPVTKTETAGLRRRRRGIRRALSRRDPGKRKSVYDLL